MKTASTTDSLLMTDVTSCLKDLRQIAKRLAQVQTQARLGSALHRSIKLVERDLANAEGGFERIILLSRQNGPR